MAGVYSCGECSGIFRNSSDYSEHMKAHTKRRRVKGDGDLYPCPYCSSSMPSSTSLLAHLRGHILRKTFPCRECHDKFDNKRDLINHRRTHSSYLNRPYLCSKCTQRFFFEKNLMKHLLKQHGLKSLKKHEKSKKLPKPAILAMKGRKLLVKRFLYKSRIRRRNNSQECDSSSSIAQDSSKIILGKNSVDEQANMSSNDPQVNPISPALDVKPVDPLELSTEIKHTAISLANTVDSTVGTSYAECKICKNIFNISDSALGCYGICSTICATSSPSTRLKLVVSQSDYPSQVIPQTVVAPQSSITTLPLPVPQPTKTYIPILPKDVQKFQEKDVNSDELRKRRYVKISPRPGELSDVNADETLRKSGQLSPKKKSGSPMKNKDTLAKAQLRKPLTVGEKIVKILPQTLVQCPFCRVQFPSNSELNQHILSSHDTAPPRGLAIRPHSRLFCCKKCSNKFTDKGIFQSHVTSCSGSPPQFVVDQTSNLMPQILQSYVCSLCSLSFLNIEELNHHLLTHQAVPQYPIAGPIPVDANGIYTPSNQVITFRCSVCPTSFSSIQDLQMHTMEKHSAVRNPQEAYCPVPQLPESSEGISYACDSCKAIYPNRQSYDAHLPNCLKSPEGQQPLEPEPPEARTNLRSSNRTRVCASCSAVVSCSALHRCGKMHKSVSKYVSKYRTIAPKPTERESQMVSQAVQKIALPSNPETTAAMPPFNSRPRASIGDTGPSSPFETVTIKEEPKCDVFSSSCDLDIKTEVKLEPL